MIRLLSRRSFIILFLSILTAGCEGTPEERAGRKARLAAEEVEAKTNQEKQQAFNAAQSFVTNELTSPGSAKFEDYNDDLVTVLSPGFYKTNGYVDSQNGFGALLRSDWTVKLHKSGDSYQVDNVSVTPSR